MSGTLRVCQAAHVALAMAIPAVGQQLLDLRLDGPDQVAENTVTYYKVFAAFDNGQEYEVTLFAELGVDPGVYAQIGVFGDLATLDVDANTVETVLAAFEFDGVRKEAQQDVVIIDRDSTGYALDFAGDQVRVPNSDSLSISGSLTIEAWARFHSPSGRGPLVFKGDGRSGLDPYQLLLESGRLHFRINNDQNQGTTVEFDVRSYNWSEFHHMVGVFDQPAGEMRLYVDGQFATRVFTELSPMNNQAGTDIVFGAKIGDPVKLDGELDEIRIWNVARSEEDIRETMNVVLCGTEPGLVANWRFNEGEGQVVRDISRYANHGTLGDSPNPDNLDPLWVLSEAPLAPAVCEPIRCDAIRKFKVTCRGGTLQVKVKSTLAGGTELTIDNNGDFAILTISGNGKGKLSWKEQSGIHTLFIRECPEFLKAVNCG